MSFPDNRHNHRRCVKRAIVQAESLCRERGVRFTPIRRRVLELVWESHRPVLAYDLLARLQHETGRAAPPTVYRALDFLVENNLVHRVESLNAFVGCSNPDNPHECQFLICESCERVAELAAPDIGSVLRSGAAKAKFEVHRPVVELRGVCNACRAADS